MTLTPDQIRQQVKSALELIKEGRDRIAWAQGKCKHPDVVAEKRSWHTQFRCPDCKKRWKESY